MNVPSDCLRVACGFCEWFFFSNIDNDGFGDCAIYGEKRYYKCMVCSEFELNYEISK